MTDKQIDKQDVKTRRDKQTMHTHDKQTNKPPVRHNRETNAEKKQRSNEQETHGGKDPERSKQAKQAMRKPPMHHLLI